MNTLIHKIWSRLRHESGQAFVEFVIVLPILVMLLLGIAQFGLAFHNYISITDATRVGARAAAVKRTNDPCGAAQNAIENTVSATQWSKVSATFQCDMPEGDDPGKPIKISVDYPYKIGLPGFSADGDLTARATERLE